MQDFDTMMQEHYDELEARYAAVDDQTQFEQEIERHYRRVHAMMLEEREQAEIAFGQFCQDLAAQWEGNDQDRFDRLYQGLLSGTISAANAEWTGKHIGTCRHLLEVIDGMAYYHVLSEYDDEPDIDSERRQAIEEDYQYYSALGCFLPRDNYYRERCRHWRRYLVPNDHSDDADLPRLASSDHDWKRIGF